MKIPSITIPLKIKEAMCSPRLAEIAENTISAVAIETALKMVGRPTFIITDKKTDPKTKKYAAIKEFLYQGTCLGLYLGIVPPVKRAINKFIISRLSKNPANAESIDAYHAESKIASTARKAYRRSGSVIDRTLSSLGLKKNEVIKTAKKELLYAEKVLREKVADPSNPKMQLCKGSKELSAIIGSVVTLAIVAPELSHFIVHPMMKILGFDKKNEEVKSQVVPQVSIKA